MPDRARELLDSTGIDDHSVAAARTPADGSSEPSRALLLFGRWLGAVWPKSDVDAGATERASPRSREPERPTPEQVGRFPILGILGRGGFATVYRALHPTLGGEIALKVLDDRALDPAARRRFIAEARLAAGVRHPNIVTVLDAGEEDGVCFIALELCDLGTLADWIHGRPAGAQIDCRQAAWIVAALADGIQAAHASNLIHRDLKPANILLQAWTGSGGGDEPGVAPKVCDFGLAKHLDGEEGLTASDVILGTRPYMAPEQVRAEPRGIGRGCDIYALGAILYELLTRRRVFGDAAGELLLLQILREDPVPPRQIRRGIPADLEAICLTCLAKRPVDRYESAAELAADLRGFLAGHPPTRARGRSVRQRLRSIARRRPRLLALGVVLAVAAPVTWAVRRETHRIAVERETDRLAGADRFTLAERVGRLEVDDLEVRRRLGELFDRGAPYQRYAAAVALAPVRDDAREHAYETWIAGPVESLLADGRLLLGRIPDLLDRLGRELDGPPAADEPDDRREARDIRRAHAAIVLLDQGRGEPAWRLLAHSPDPQARSFLIDRLGPAGIGPDVLLDRLRDEPDASVRRALVLALGEVPESAWRSGQRDEAIADFLGRYETDPDAGFHSAVGWLLRRWGLDDRLLVVDGRLAGREPPDGRRWRVNRMGMTLVEVDDPKHPRVVALGATEVTVGQLRELLPEAAPELQVSPTDRHPANNVSYRLALEYCNRLSARDGLPPDQWCYAPDASGVLRPVEGHLDRPGYRLPTEAEFEAASAAGSTRLRFYGETGRLLYRYARYNSGGELAASPVGSLKPNDLGLFDTLGNVIEICEDRDPGGTGAAILGGGFSSSEFTVPMPRSGRFPPEIRLPNFGFRVARTVRARGG